ncbi:MAG: hypothetical protein GXX85_01975 [Ignavibacteria bacterium]|nr:hypothetical protein [Ignavibacteria bacterium]
MGRKITDKGFGDHFDSWVGEESILNYFEIKMNYIFFRIYEFYRKKDDSPLLSGILFMFALHICVFFPIAIIIKELYEKYFQLIIIPKGIEKIILYLICFGILVYNIFKYSRHNFVKNIRKKYETSKYNNIVKTWQIFILPIAIIICTLLGIVLYKHLFLK